MTPSSKRTLGLMTGVEASGARSRYLKKKPNASRPVATDAIIVTVMTK